LTPIGIPAQLEGGHRLAGPDNDRGLAGHGLDVGDGSVDGARVLDRLAEADVDHDLLDPGHLHGVAVAELAHQLGDHLLLVLAAEARGLGDGDGHQLVTRS
jgi:hypothetical protein